MSFSYGSRSRSRLDTCDSRLVEICQKAIGYGVMDISIITGHRDKITQNEKFDQGLSQIRWPNGKHNSSPSTAVDVAPYPIDWEDTGRFIIVAGIMFVAAAELGYVLRWGGDWNSDGFQRDENFRDWGHFELRLNGE